MRKLFIFLIILIILGLIGWAWWSNNLLPVNISDASTKIFVVKKQASIRGIANALKEENLIRSPVVFFLLVKQRGIENKIQAGNFKLSPSESTTQIADDLTHGVLDIKVTIPEGKRAEEVAAILKEKLSSYDNSWISTLKAHEGYLFPDTYLIPSSADIHFILTMFKNNFTTHFTRAVSDRNVTFTDSQIITIASLVEREAKFEEDRPLIASVIENRLKINMALQIDSSVQYALGYQEQTGTWWKNPPTQTDLQFPSVYNTYQNPGLPAGPICNPGEASIAAAAHPANSSYLFYLADKSGHSHFAKTLDEQNANIRKYGL